MKKTGLIIFSLLVILTVLRTSSDYVMKTYYRTTARHIATLDYQKLIPKKNEIDYLIIGDSVPLHALQAQMISKNSYSICISGASVFDIWMSLQKIDLHRVRKGIIFFSSFNSGLHNNEDFWKRFVLTGSYSMDELKKFYKTGETFKFFPATNYSYSIFVTKAFLTSSRLNQYPFEILARYLNSRIWTSDYYKQNREWLELRNGSLPIEIPGDSFKLSDEEFNEPNRDFYSKPFQPDASDIFYFRNILSYVQGHKLNVFIPMIPVANGKLPKDIRDFYASEVKAYRGTFIAPMDVSLGSSDFFDFNHLNSAGSAKATEALKKWLIAQ